MSEQRKNAKKKTVEHRAPWRQIDAFIQEREVVFVWVEAHAGSPGNEEADALAKLGAIGKRIEERGTLAVPA